MAKLTIYKKRMEVNKHWPTRSLTAQGLSRVNFRIWCSSSMSELPVEAQSKTILPSSNSDVT